MFCPTAAPCAVKFPEHMALTAPCAPVRIYPYFSVPIRIGIAHSIGSAQCTLPASGNVLCFPENAPHLEHGGKPYFSPCSSPFSPVCCKMACGTQCGGCGTLPCGRLSGLRRHGAAAMWSAVGLTPSRASGGMVPLPQNKAYTRAFLPIRGVGRHGAAAIKKARHILAHFCR